MSDRVFARPYGLQCSQTLKHIIPRAGRIAYLVSAPRRIRLVEFSGCSASLSSFQAPRLSTEAIDLEHHTSADDGDVQSSKMLTIRVLSVGDVHLVASLLLALLVLLYARLVKGLPFIPPAPRSYAIYNYWEVQWVFPRGEDDLPCKYPIEPLVGMS